MRAETHCEQDSMIEVVVASNWPMHVEGRV